MGRKYKGSFYLKIISFSFCCCVLFTNCKGGSLTSSPNKVTLPSEQEEKPQVPLGEDQKTEDQLPLGPDAENQDKLPLDEDPHQKTHQFSITQLAHENTKLDMVWVIDNSGSMNGNHQDLRNRFSHLFNQNLRSSDWQIAFISSAKGDEFYYLKDSSGGNLQGNPRILSPKLPNFEDIFKNTISSKQFGESSTREFQAIFDMINDPEKEPGFFRPDALLAVVVVTDDTDTSEPGPLDIMESVKNNFGPSKKFVTYGIIVEPDRNCGEPRVNYKVADLALRTGGITGSICEKDYSFVMASIGDHIQKELLFKDIPLKHNNVIENSIKLAFTPAQNEQNWQFDSQTNKITFNIPPIEGTTVQISYDYHSEPNN